MTEIVVHKKPLRNGPSDRTASLSVSSSSSHLEAATSRSEVSPGKSARVLEYASKIRAQRCNAAEAILAITKLCAEANEALSPSEKEELLNELTLTASCFSKLVKIASDPRLKAAEMAQKLPSGWTVLYEVALLSAGDFNDAIAEGIVHPNMTRTTLKKWQSSRRLEAATSAVGAPNTIAADPGLSIAPIEKSSILTEHHEPSPVQNLDDIPPFLDRRPLSPEEERELDAIEAAYNAACPFVQERFWTIRCRSPSQ
jgi:hypothetical protein